MRQSLPSMDIELLKLKKFIQYIDLSSTEYYTLYNLLLFDNSKNKKNMNNQKKVDISNLF